MGEIKHNLSTSRIYQIHENIKKRCNNPDNPAYKNYGGRGIEVCDEWQASFENFYKWAIANGYTDNLTLDRIENDGDYKPSNCRWVTMKVQQNNRTNNHRIEYKNEIKTVSEWGDITGISPKLICQRIVRGIPIEDALSKPVIKKNKMKIKGLGKLIRDHRKSLDMFQSEYGQLYGVDKTNVSAWELGKSNSSSDKLEKFIFMANIDVETLFYEDGTPFKEKGLVE